MPYQPYQPTWNNPYLPATNQGQPVLPVSNPYQQPVNGIVRQQRQVASSHRQS